MKILSKGSKATSFTDQIDKHDPHVCPGMLDFILNISQPMRLGASTRPCTTEIKMIEKTHQRSPFYGMWVCRLRRRSRMKVGAPPFDPLHQRFFILVQQNAGFYKAYQHRDFSEAYPLIPLIAWIVESSFQIIDAHELLS